MKNNFILMIFFIAIAYSLPLSQLSFPQGFWKIEVGSFDLLQGDIMMAFADFNQDRFADIVTVDSLTQTKIFIYKWDINQGEFIKNQLNVTTSSPIVSIIPSDFNYDGQTDILVTYDQQVSYQIQLRILLNCITKCQFKIINDTEELLIRLDKVEPFLIDLDGSRIPEFFISKNQERLIVQLVNNDHFQVKPFQKSIYVYVPPPQQDVQTIPVQQIIYNNTLKNHFASIIDWNGDCMADLVLLSQKQQTKVIQFYKSNTNGTFASPKLIQISQNVISLSFSDLNFDGSIDMVLLYNSQQTGKPFIQIHYNVNGNPKSGLCLENTVFPFEFGSVDSGILKRILRQQLKGNLAANKIPIMRFGDINSDGYPDLVLNLLRQNQFKVQVSVPVFYLNKKCINQTCGTFNLDYIATSNISNVRYFSQFSISTINVTNVHSIVFYDFYQNGRVDFIINYYQIKKNKDKIYYMYSVYNNKQQDAFFLKAICVNGVENLQKASTHWFGVTFQWKITTLSGQFIRAVGNQQFQVAHQSMQLPFVLAGLGRTNNYIQQFTVGLMQNNMVYKRVWSPIVPNTQLIIIPQTKDTSSWKLAIYMEPTQKIKIVFQITILSLIVIGLMIYYYHNKQKLQDRQNMENFYTLLK